MTERYQQNLLSHLNQAVPPGATGVLGLHVASGLLVRLWTMQNTVRLPLPLWRRCLDAHSMCAALILPPSATVWLVSCRLPCALPTIRGSLNLNRQHRPLASNCSRCTTRIGPWVITAWNRVEIALINLVSSMAYPGWVWFYWLRLPL